MQLRYNYRLYPTPGQRAALARAFGCAQQRFRAAHNQAKAVTAAPERKKADPVAAE